MTDIRRGKLVFVAVTATLILAASVGLGLLLSQTESAPQGPVEVIWDREVCAHCNMHVGEPGFAAQLHTTAGDVLNFDDPGCLFEYVAERRPEVSGQWFHHLREERWLTPSSVAFIHVDSSPMGYGLAAVDADGAGASGQGSGLTFEQARALVVDSGDAGGDVAADVHDHPREH